MLTELFYNPIIKHLEPLQTPFVVQFFCVTAASGSVPPQRQHQITPQTNTLKHNSHNLPKQKSQNHTAALAPSLHLSTNSPLGIHSLTIPEYKQFILCHRL